MVNISKEKLECLLLFQIRDPRKKVRRCDLPKTPLRGGGGGLILDNYPYVDFYVHLCTLLCTLRTLLRTLMYTYVHFLVRIDSYVTKLLVLFLN